MNCWGWRLTSAESGEKAKVMCGRNRTCPFGVACVASAWAFMAVSGTASAVLSLSGVCIKTSWEVSSSVTMIPNTADSAFWSSDSCGNEVYSIYTCKYQQKIASATWERPNASRGYCTVVLLLYRKLHASQFDKFEVWNESLTKMWLVMHLP